MLTRVVQETRLRSDSRGSSLGMCCSLPDQPDRERYLKRTLPVLLYNWISSTLFESIFNTVGF